MHRAVGWRVIGGSEIFHVDLEVRNDRLGFLFGYHGSFTCEWVPATDTRDG